MPARFNHTIPSVIAALFIFLFLYTALNKFTGHQSFESVLHSSPLLKNASFILSWLIPFTELVITLLLFIPASRQTGLFYSFLLMSLFTAYIAYMVLNASQLPCSCGGILQQLSWQQHLLLNIILSILAATGYLLEKTNKRFIAINRGS